MKHKNQICIGCSKSSSKKEVYSDTSLPQETRKTSNKQPNFNLKELEKEEQTKPKVSGKKKRKIRAEINEMETKTKNKKQTKNTIEKINETKSWYFGK